jgi:hypothetical protein
VNEESRKELHEQFVRKVAKDHPVGTPVAAHELTRLARTLGTQLPAAYAEFLRRHGALVCSTAMRDAPGAERAELRQLLAPQDVVNISRAMWCDLLPVDMFIFGFDANDNTLCFQVGNQARDDAPVFMWSAKRERLLRVAESFDELLAYSLAGARNGVAA